MVYRKNADRVVYGPCSEKQRLFLNENYVDILVVGGGSGSGKSTCALIKALSFINDPKARVVIMRKTLAMLNDPGALIDESHNIYPNFKAVYKKQHKKWIFPNSATIQFKYLPQNLGDLQGMQATNVIIDEMGEDFTEEDILFIYGRMRAKQEYKGYKCLIGTCNPNRNSFLYDWVKFSLDESTGIPVSGTEHKIRFFCNRSGKLYWGDSPSEVIEKIKEVFGENITEEDLTTFKYIPMTITDNPKIDPSYLRRLKGQSRVNQLRFIHGSWTAVPEGQGCFRREWAPYVSSVQEKDIVARVRSWDLASTKPSEANRNPDYTVGVLLAKDCFGVYYIEDVVRFRETPDVVLKKIIETAMLDGPEVVVTIPKDTASGGKIATHFFTTELAKAGVAVRTIEVSGHSSKMKKFLPFCTVAESGFVRIVRDDSWNEAYLTELETFINVRNRKDDQVDATSDAFKTLAREFTSPEIFLPDLGGNYFIPSVC